MCVFNFLALWACLGAAWFGDKGDSILHSYLCTRRYTQCPRLIPPYFKPKTSALTIASPSFSPHTFFRAWKTQSRRKDPLCASSQEHHSNTMHIKFLLFVKFRWENIIHFCMQSSCGQKIHVKSKFSISLTGYDGSLADSTRSWRSVLGVQACHIQYCQWLASNTVMKYS